MSDDLKRLAAERAIQFVRNGHTVGLGTGSTAIHAINGIGRLVREGMALTGVATSIATARLAQQLGIPLSDLNDVEQIDITIDGADEVSPGFDMIKGGGGALTREKLVAISSRRRIIVVDDSKLVPVLGTKFPVPVEVLPFAWRLSERWLRHLGGQPTLRLVDGEPFVTDNGNYIIDSSFGLIDEPASLEISIKQIPGVVENGLFVGIADVLVIGHSTGIEVRERT